MPTHATQSPWVGLSSAVSRKLISRRPSGAYLPVWRSPVSARGSSRGSVHVAASSSENITCEFLARRFSRRSIASSVPSGERITPGSQRWMSLCFHSVRGLDQVRPASDDSIWKSVMSSDR